ncbi:MAG: hypothetical protein EBQ96_09940 [Proteobacteria bacterium]|nr:hypothetical protein [Pseudomonadota bacterium]
MDAKSPLELPFKFSADPCRHFPDRAALLQLTVLREPFSRVNVMMHVEDQVQAEHLLEQGQVPTFDGFEKTNCFGCNACIPVRIDLQQFDVEGRRGGLLEANSDLRFSLVPGLPHESTAASYNDAVSLFERHLQSSFNRGCRDEAAGILDSLAGFPGLTPYTLSMFTVDENGKPVLAGYMVLLQALNSVYAALHAYEPALRHRSPGNILMLKTIGILKDQKITEASPHLLYLGNWTPRPSRLSWKEQYAPLELRLGREWVTCDRKAIEAIKKRSCSSGFRQEQR